MHTPVTNLLFQVWAYYRVEFGTEYKKSIFLSRSFSFRLPSPPQNAHMCAHVHIHTYTHAHTRTLPGVRKAPSQVKKQEQGHSGLLASRSRPWRLKIHLRAFQGQL